MPPTMTDVLVIGAGVIGCAAALALSRRGASVRVLERSGGLSAQLPLPGALGTGDGASWAAAGILGAQVESDEDGPMARLCLAGRERYPAWSASLAEATGIDVGYRRSGALRVAYDEEERDDMIREVAWQREAGLSFTPLDRDAARAAEPELSLAVAGGVRFPDDARIDPPSLMRALRIAAERAGAMFGGGSPARRVLVDGGQAWGAALEDGTTLSAARVVLAAGCWSSLIEGAALQPDAVRPARGQIVELLPATPVLQQVVYGPGCYLSPRDDGRVLVGATTEFVGFTPGNTARAVHDLVAAALRLVPALGDAAMGRCWSGLRPHTPDELPLLGEGEIRNLIFATGHFRNGILLGPITAEIVAALTAGEPSPLDLGPFAPTRLQMDHAAGG